jgi:uroporphyrinogen decarboxylase
MDARHISPVAKKWRDFYSLKPDAPLLQREFGFYSLEEWKAQGMPQDVPHASLFGFDEPGFYPLQGLGWCEAAFSPPFKEEVIEDRGDHEVVRDFAGRHVLCFKGRRSGFMPHYHEHPVKNMETWQRDCLWRLDPETSGRWTGTFRQELDEAKRKEAEGFIIVQRVIGGYMYLRSLIGPEDLLYAFYDQPDLIHACMAAWLKLADRVVAAHQKEVTLDEIFFGEDICYNNGALISPDMMREFLLPYYQQIIANTRSRQLDKTRHLHVQIDTDGWVVPVIDIYRDAIGMDVMSPFEVASGCDVVEIGRQFPNLVMSGGIDKRVLAEGKDAIDRMVDRILPVMQKRGGFMPTCDHGVPAEVKYEDYLHYRKRVLEFA